MSTRDTHRQGEEIAKAPSAMVDWEHQSALLTLSGTPEVVTFAGLGLEDMEDDQYVVHLSGEFASAAYVDESTKTAAGFSIVDGAASEVANITVHGKIASRKR